MPHPDNVTQIQSYYCSFCGRNNLQVDYIITATPSINICDECVSICNEIITQKKSKIEDKNANG